MEPGAAGLRRVALVGALLLVVGACGDGDGAATSDTAPSDAAAPPTTAIAGCADVVGVEVVPAGAGYTFRVTVRSADTGWEKYADAWQVVGPGGEVLGTRELAHPHVDEQPFTRSLTGVVIPDGTGEVTVRARDSVAGWCGEERAVTVP